jgi:hypothetical protein
MEKAPKQTMSEAFEEVCTRAHLFTRPERGL